MVLIWISGFQTFVETFNHIIMKIKKMSIILIAGLGLLACNKQEIELEDVKSEMYVLEGQEYEVTYREDPITGERTLAKTSVNEKIGNYLKEHEQAVMVSVLSDKTFLYSSMQEFEKHRHEFFKESSHPMNEEKTSYNPVQTTFYEHAGFVNPLFVNIANVKASTLTNTTLTQSISTLIGSNWGNARVYSNDWVGTVQNDKISSFQTVKLNNGLKGSAWNYFVVAIFEHNNYGGDVHFSIDSDTEMPLRTTRTNLQAVSMWGGFNNFNDEISSYWGGGWQ